MDMDLSETFKMFDTDGDGTVDLKEAKQAHRVSQDIGHEPLSEADTRNLDDPAGLGEV